MGWLGYHVHPRGEERAHELYSGSSGAPVCRDTSGTSPRRCDTAWLHTLMRSHRMTSALNACARRDLHDACAHAAAHCSMVLVCTIEYKANLC